MRQLGRKLDRRPIEGTINEEQRVSTWCARLMRVGASVIGSCGVSLILLGPIAATASTVDLRSLVGNFDQSSWGQSNTTLYAQSLVADGTTLEEVRFSATCDSGTPILFQLLITGARADAGGGLGLAPNFADIRFSSGSLSIPSGAGTVEVTVTPNLPVTVTETLFVVLDTFSYPTSGVGTVRATAYGAAIDPYPAGEFVFLNTLGTEPDLQALDSETWSHRSLDNEDLAVLAIFASSVCGNSVIESGEQCDDGNTANGDCCSSTCQYEGGGSPCDDATVCNGNETCDGAGSCLPGTPLDCDDGDACTADSCDPVGGCINDDAPATGCLTGGKSLMLIKQNASDHGKDKLLWKWIKGAQLSQMDLADPQDTTVYALCVYAGTANALIADAALPPGTSGWSPIGTKGYKFKGTSPDGLSLALLKGGAAGKSKALAKGKGATLPDPMLPLDYPVTVQLKKDGSSLCLESTFTSANEKKNTDTQFKAKK
jgi:cysteine-rich repeat protein